MATIESMASSGHHIFKQESGTEDSYDHGQPLTVNMPASS